MTLVRTLGDRRYSLLSHDHDRRYARLGSGGGGGEADVTLTGTEGVTVVESPANTFALGLTASPDANNTIEIRSNGIYAASGAIPPEYVTDTELATALGPYATDADLAAHAGAADPHPTYATDADLSAHAAAADPHPTYLTAAEGNAAYATTGHTHDGAYSPVSHHHDAAYYNVAGDSLAGHMTLGAHNAYDIGVTGTRLRKLWAVDLETTNVPTVGGVSLDSRYATPASVTSAIATHEGATNPHPAYATDADLSAHAAAADPHPVYALDTDLSTHAGAADPHTGYLRESVLTAKGDLYAATAASTPARLAVGADTQVLTADSTQPSGMRWATPASGGMTNPMTAKGDLIAGGAAGVATRLGVGTNGQMLTADSAQTLGVRWTTPFTQATADTLYATIAALNALTARVATLEAQITGHTHTSGTIDAMGGPAVMP